MIAALKVDGTYYPIFCAKTAEINTNQDEIEVTNINSGANREYIPGMSDHTLSASGITTLDNSDGQISLNYLNQQAQRRAIQELRVAMTDDDAGTLQITFNGFLTSATLSKQTGAYSQSSVTFRITGPINYSEVITPPATPICQLQPTIVTALAEGDNVVTVTEITVANAQVLWVSRSGFTYHPIDAGTPGDQQYLIDYGAGTITFNPDYPGTDPAGEPVLIGWQITE